jgi:hypothetical protein
MLYEVLKAFRNIAVIAGNVSKCDASPNALPFLLH